MVELVSKVELIAILNKRMRSLPHGKDATVTEVIRLRHSETAGNWIPDFATTNSHEALLDVFAHSRGEFILKAE